MPLPAMGATRRASRSHPPARAREPAPVRARLGDRQPGEPGPRKLRPYACGPGRPQRLRAQQEWCAAQSRPPDPCAAGSSGPTTLKCSAPEPEFGNLATLMAEDVGIRRLSAIAQARQMARPRKAGSLANAGTELVRSTDTPLMPCLPGEKRPLRGLAVPPIENRTRSRHK